VRGSRATRSRPARRRAEALGPGTAGVLGAAVRRTALVPGFAARTMPPMIDARLTVLAALLAASCGRAPDAAPTAAGPDSPAPNPGFVAEHEFGLIPHGVSHTAELPIPVPEHGGPWIPVGFLRACSCAQHEYVLQAADGSTRIIAGNGLVD